MREAGNAPGYVVLLLDIRDAEAYETYLKEASKTVTDHGGKFLVSSDRPDLREGSWPCERTIIIEFPSVADATAWYASDDYRPLISQRQHSTGSRVAIFEGSPG